MLKNLLINMVSKFIIAIDRNIYILVCTYYYTGAGGQKAPKPQN